MADIDEACGIGCAGVFIGAGIVGLLAWCVLSDSRDAWRKQAIEHGAASYEIADEKTGAVEFRWREKP